VPNCMQWRLHWQNNNSQIRLPSQNRNRCAQKIVNPVSDTFWAIPASQSSVIGSLYPC
jgi:hypothetical protein